MIKKINKNQDRLKRHKRVRLKIKGTAEAPRLSVYRTLDNIYAQIIDDSCGKTLCSASTMDKSFRGTGSTSNCEAATKVGAMLAAKAIEAGIKEVVFDRGGFSYHGRVKALADAARGAGLSF